ncbi:hypothetical protein GCM10011487_61660 [Steroidobacter agaridevorans]|uniref:Transmembrane protein n=1 Tax=Steroidobacter agaridevorans TaxID=2695856 RepID=A0A829YNV0_9GAMM|nr:hypothetical protein [Steroidobacter agaridevorans]GFE84166.1 hypothetical protein GCM10011487_61660 [Steroidobacter agaridevorans]GFE86988.1 hypothetical protein GCM10011488_19420 [Steroidobacter agaridevorans]
MKRAGLLAVCFTILPSVLLLDVVRHVIESRMLLHMLLEFPVLFLSGAAAGALMLAHWDRAARVVEKMDYRGLTAITLVLCVSAYWMIPASLDNSLLRPGVAFVKYTSWWFGGWMLAVSWQRMSEVLRMFMLGNLCWMFGSVGLLYQASESRLCVNYLFGDQQMTGRALVTVAVFLAALLAYRAYWYTRSSEATA